jgi:hypothetical protein
LFICGNLDQVYCFVIDIVKSEHKDPNAFAKAALATLPAQFIDFFSKA